MRFHFAHLDNLRELYVDQIQHLHSAETQICEALPDVVEAATDTELKRVLEDHLQETREQLLQLEDILDHTAGQPESKQSKAIAALIDESKDLIADAKNEKVRDAAIITTWLRIERYEITAYEAVRDFSEIIGETSHANLHEHSLQEEKKAAAALTNLWSAANAMADRAA